MKKALFLIFAIFLFHNYCFAMANPPQQENQTTTTEAYVYVIAPTDDSIIIIDNLISAEGILNTKLFESGTHEVKFLSKDGKLLDSQLFTTYSYPCSVFQSYHLYATLSKKIAGIEMQVESSQLSNNMITVKVNIFNNKTYPIKIDPSKLIVKDKDSTMLKPFNADEVSKQEQANDPYATLAAMESMKANQQTTNNQNTQKPLFPISNDNYVVEPGPDYGFGTTYTVKKEENPLASIFQNNNSQQSPQTDHAANAAALFMFSQQNKRSIDETIHANYFSEVVSLPPQSRIKRVAYYSLVDTQPPYKIQFLINGVSFNFPCLGALDKY